MEELKNKRDKEEILKNVENVLHTKIMKGRGITRRKIIPEFHFWLK